MFRNLLRVLKMRAPVHGIHNKKHIHLRETFKIRLREVRESQIVMKEKPKKRPAWRPKKNKLLVQYPEYIQDAFFGKDIMDSLDVAKNPEDFLEESFADTKAAAACASEKAGKTRGLRQ